MITLTRHNKLRTGLPARDWLLPTDRVPYFRQTQIDWLAREIGRDSCPARGQAGCYGRSLFNVNSIPNRSQVAMNCCVNCAVAATPADRVTGDSESTCPTATDESFLTDGQQLESVLRSRLTCKTLWQSQRWRADERDR